MLKVMKTMNLNLTVQNVRTFANADGRQFINLITVQSFPKRSADKETGEFVEGVTNEFVMPLRQFMHVAFVTPNFLQVFFKDFDRKYYTVMTNGEWYSLLLGATISVVIERYEDGDTFINEITNEEESSDDVTYHTHLTKIKLATCGRKFALHKEDDFDAVEETITELEGLVPTVHKFVLAEKEAEKEAEKKDENPAEKPAE